MGDKDAMTCPIQSFTPDFASSNTNAYHSDNQNSLVQNDDRKEGFGTKEDSTVQLNFQNPSLPKRFDENLDSQDELPNPDLHNGHNNPDAIDIGHKNKSLGELLKESEELPDSVLMTEFSSNKETEQNSEEKKESKGTMEQEQISVDRNDGSNQEGQFSEEFDLHLSETQSFLPPQEKENDVQPVSESEEEGRNDVQKYEVEKSSGRPEDVGRNDVQKYEVEKSSGRPEDVEISNGSPSESIEEKESEQEIAPKESSEVPAKEMDKSEIVKDSEESLNNGLKAEEEEKPAEEDNLCKISSKPKEVPKDEIKEGSDLKEEKPDEEPKVDDKEEEKTAEAMEVDSADKGPDEETSGDETVRTMISKGLEGLQQRMEKVAHHLASACSQLDEFIKLKRREENKHLKNFLEMLKEIHSISVNEEIVGESKISDHALIPENDTGGRRKASKRKSNDLDSPLKETPRKKAAEEKSARKAEKEPAIDFKDVKGLAVFAKWPNSGWYYPGKVKELTGTDWKDASNVTVTFYDGLIREMKNINILPAHLIPPGSMLCDLEDETEMVVLSCDGSNENSVDFKLSTKDSSEEIELNFNKLAIRANHMKTIKAQLEPTSDVAPKKMHMVSLDNLVSGRRSRGRSKKDDSDTEEKTPVQSERRYRSSASTPAKKATPRRARN